MLQQLTALFLILAMANPFCCCFGADNSSISSSTNTTPTHFCCHSTPEKDTDTPLPCGDNCPCDQSVETSGELHQVASVAEQAPTNSVAVLSPDSTWNPHYSGKRFIPVMPHTKDPPPPCKLSILYCVSRI